MAPEEAEEICKDADINGDGNINYKSFVQLITATK